MKEAGMLETEIANQFYYNHKIYTDCVDRYILSPKMLYQRVRAVYVFYGNMIDSRTKNPRFNAAAWKKADTVLKEILQGFYSDPPGFDMYTKSLNRDGSITTNKYEMEMIESCRGTNWTEAYHKQRVTMFGTWHTGVKMSECLLAVRRHSHNLNQVRSEGWDF